MKTIEDHYFKAKTGHYYDIETPEGWVRYQLESGNLSRAGRLGKMEQLKDILVGELESLTESYKALVNETNR